MPHQLSLMRSIVDEPMIASRRAIETHSLEAAADSAPAPSKAMRPRDTLQLLTVTTALLLPLLYFHEFPYPSWTPKTALLAVVAGPGLAAALQAAVRGSTAARLGIAFLASAALSTVLSDRPLLAVAGPMNFGTGLIYLVGVVGLWALGARLTSLRRVQLESVLLAGACVNALLAWIRLAGPSGVLFDYSGGASGFLGNSTMLGALCAGGLWLTVDRIARRRGSLLWLGCVVLLAGGAQLSVQRAAVALCAIALVLTLRKASIKRAAMVTFAALLGFGLAGALATHSHSGSSSTERTFSAGALSDRRPETWRVSLSVAAEHPFFGVGPGRFASAVEPHATPGMSEGDATWTDAHNFVVHSAVTLGLFGTGLMLGWLTFAARRARGPLAGFALIVGVFSLVEPQYVALTPLGLLALGAAAPPSEPQDVTLRGPWLIGAWGLGFIGACVAVLMLVGQMLMASGLNEYSIADARRAASILPWSAPLQLQAAIENHYDLRNPGNDLSRPLATARKAVRVDPSDVRSWELLGGIETRAGHLEAALEAYRGAINVFPWHGAALERLAEIASQLGDDQGHAEACRKLAVLRVSTDACPS
jgi:hypothetical protein